MGLKMQSGSRRSRAGEHSAVIPRCGPASPLRGQLSTKSNAFCIESTRSLINQYLIRDNMVVHYNRILSAKAVVDCSMPKSRLSSIKFADQQRREKLKKKIDRYEEKMCEGASRACSRDRAMMLPPCCAKTCLEAEARHFPCAAQGQYLAGAPSPYVKHGLVRSSPVKHTRKCARNTCKACRAHSHPCVCTSRSPSKRSGVPCRHSADNFVCIRCSRRCPRMGGGDLLEKHAECFTRNRKPFIPRTLISDAKPYLSEYRFYSPARRKKKIRRKQRVEAETQTDMISFPSSDQVYTSKVTAEPQKIPPKTTPKTTPKITPKITPKAEDRRHILDERERAIDKSEPSILRDTSRPQKSSPRRSPEDEEEELLYLTFIEDVTNEILSLGLFSNRILDQVFEWHIEENKDRLDEAKMRQMLDALKADLGCGPDSEIEFIGAGDGGLDSLDLPELEMKDLEFSSKGHRLKKATKSKEGFDAMDLPLKKPSKCVSLSGSERSGDSRSRERFPQYTTEAMDAGTESDSCGVEFEERPDISPTCEIASGLATCGYKVLEPEESFSIQEGASDLATCDSDLEVSKELEPEESCSTHEEASDLAACDSDLEVSKELDEPEESCSIHEEASDLAACDSDLEVSKELEESCSTREAASDVVACDSDLEVSKELEESCSTREAASDLAACDSDLEVNKDLEDLEESFAEDLHISHSY